MGHALAASAAPPAVARAQAHAGSGKRPRGSGGGARGDGGGGCADGWVSRDGACAGVGTEPAEQSEWQTPVGQWGRGSAFCPPVPASATPAHPHPPAPAAERTREPSPQPSPEAVQGAEGAQGAEERPAAATPEPAGPAPPRKAKVPKVTVSLCSQGHALEAISAWSNPNPNPNPNPSPNPNPNPNPLLNPNPNPNEAYSAWCAGGTCDVCLRGIAEGEQIWVCQPCKRLWWACTECRAPDLVLGGTGADAEQRHGREREVAAEVAAEATAGATAGVAAGVAAGATAGARGCPPAADVLAEMFSPAALASQLLPALPQRLGALEVST